MADVSSFESTLETALRTILKEEMGELTEQFIKTAVSDYEQALRRQVLDVAAIGISNLYSIRANGAGPELIITVFQKQFERVS